MLTLFVWPCCYSLRLWDWHITVWALLLLLIGILPWYHSYRAFVSSGESHSRRLPCEPWQVRCAQQQQQQPQHLEGRHLSAELGTRS